MVSPHTDISLSATRLRPGLFLVMALVIVAGLAAEIMGAVQGLPTDGGVVPMLSLSYEWNVPTVYTAALIGLCALALALLAVDARRRAQGHAGHWWALAVGFGWIGLDELLGIHEQADRLVDLNHLVHFDWVVPAAVLLVALLAAFVPFLRHLPPRPRWRFVVAGAIYVGGAVGMELPLGWWTARHGSHNLGYALIDALEESLEMLGLNLFLLALLDHLADRGVGLRFGHVSGDSGQVATAVDASVTRSSGQVTASLDVSVSGASESATTAADALLSGASGQAASMAASMSGASGHAASVELSTREAP